MKLLITGALKITIGQTEQLKNLGAEIFFMQDEKGILPIEPSMIEGIICNGLFLYHDVKKFANLKFVQLTSAGFDRVPMDYCNDKGIKVLNARGVYSIPMAEFAVMGVLSLYKNSKFFFENQKNAVWEKHRGILELCGRTVAILGCGSVGTECAKRFNAFGCKVIGVDIVKVDNVGFDETYLIEDLDKVLHISDVVVLTLPLTDKTEGLIDADKFGKMKDGCVFVNIARGKIVKTDALTKALENKLFGAVLDVFEEEPLDKNSPLWEMDNVILTPHNSFVSDKNSDRLFMVIMENLEKVL